MDERKIGEYLGDMVLLSEIIGRIRNEIASWPTYQDMMVCIDINANLHDIRAGSEAFLLETLLLPVRMICVTARKLEIEITGSDDAIHVTYSPANSESLNQWISSGNPLPAHASRWNPEIITGNQFMTMILKLPATHHELPVDIGVFAEETGLTPLEIHELLASFVERSRVHLEKLRQKKRQYSERFRAAHSLKGAGKTIRAPELIAAARAVERDIQDRVDYQTNLRNLESVWLRIEHMVAENAGRGERKE